MAHQVVLAVSTTSVSATPTLPGSSATPNTPTIDQTPALSKNARKKAAKAERYAAYKLERRAREKQARKEKKRIRAEKRAAGELDDGDDDEKQQNKKIKLEFEGRVVIDLGFDDKMSDKEITSLCSQLAYTYSANRNASFPFSLLYTSLNGRTLTRLESMNDAGYKRWTGTEWWEDGYEQLWLRQESAAENQRQTPEKASCPDASHSEKLEELDTPASRKMRHFKGSKEPTRTTQDTVVYLTADSEEELMELRPEETYIIGGICDHNRYKNLCLNKANESRIRTARLPIGRYLASLPTRKVLTVNQVFEILVKWVEMRNWEEALYTVIPKRKFQTGVGKGDAPAAAPSLPDESPAAASVANEGELNSAGKSEHVKGTQAKDDRLDEPSVIL
ncbi:hypothetical protein AMATHDRAFT_148071 [Amanita thiersii Skay4041]|uniref:tRNA (guanine(9)-N1)-methyltransferase n=1 Tax=Amanita thiersii Skay4041 TaxID=703135 RepID=A0A2A9NNL5_9AGAR|nr:hypothetical protein AMATHDRAFT_148071 [Amanita thiersii Skay4041]